MNMEPKKKSNWLWIVLLIGGALVFTPIACCGGVGLMGYGMVKKPLEQAARVMEEDERIAGKIGTPIKYDTLVVSDFNISNGEGSADLDTNFSGPNGRVHVKGEMLQSGGNWSPGDLTVTFDDGTEVKLPE